jgi:hypothetical protein
LPLRQKQNASVLACRKLRDFLGIQLAERMQSRTLDMSLLKLGRRPDVQQKRLLFASLRGKYPADRCFHAVMVFGLPIDWQRAGIW